MKESIFIAAPAGHVWSYIVDASRWPEWQKKIVALTRSRSGPVVPDEEMNALFKSRRQQTDTRIHIRNVGPGHRLELRQHFQKGTRNRHVDVRFEIRPEKGGCRVTQALNHRAAMPWFFRVLIWLLLRLGRPSSTSPLEQLKTAAEEIVTP